MGGLASSITNEDHIIPAALAGDVWALKIIRECTRPLARTLLSNVMGGGLERLFIVGGFAQALGRVYRQILLDLMIEMSHYAVVREVIPSLIDVGANTYNEPCLKGCGVFLRLAEQRQ
jgi:glucokinase